MKIGDIVKLKDNPETEWMNTYKDYLFEVEAVFERNCRVRMLDCLLRLVSRHAPPAFYRRFR